MRLIKFVPVFLLLTSCEPAPLYLKVSPATKGLNAEVYEKWWFGLRSSETPCVHDVTLTRSSDAKVIWRMAVPPESQCGDLKTFVVGKAPPGFRDDVRLSVPLSAGNYKLAAYGIGFGSVEFRLPMSS